VCSPFQDISLCAATWDTKQLCLNKRKMREQWGLKPWKYFIHTFFPLKCITFTVMTRSCIFL
jgi:hypothetical protein